MILKPAVLRPGDGIGVIAPAGPVTPDDLEPGLRHLEALGFRVVPGDHVYDSLGYTAGDDATRLEDLHAMFARPEVRAVLCARGGYGCLRLLPRIDLDLIRSHPKVLVGYSDVTALLMGLHAATGLITFHGPVVKALPGEEARDLDRLLRWVGEGARPPVVDLAPHARVVRGGRATGPVLGGNLSLMCHLLGTPFLPSLDRAVLFLEDTREPLYKIDRMLTHLALAGVFDRLSAVLVGDFNGNGAGDDVLGLLEEHLPGRAAPVVAGLSVGHAGRNVPVPIGMEATLDTGRMELVWHEPCVLLDQRR